MPSMIPLYSVTLPASVKLSQAREAIVLILSPARVEGGASVIGLRQIESSSVEARITVGDERAAARLEEILEPARLAGKAQGWHRVVPAPKP